jgi:hypothetical protein
LLIEAQHENAELLAENRRLALTNAIHRLDSEWAAQRQALMVRGRGGPQVPSELLGWVLILLGGFVLLAGIEFLIESGRLDLLILVAVGTVVAGLGCSQLAAGHRFKVAKRRYEQRRVELCEELAQAELTAEKQSDYRQRKYEDTTSRRKRLDGLSYPAADA